MALFDIDSIFDTCTEWEPSGTLWTEWMTASLMLGGSVWCTYDSGSEGSFTGSVDSTTTAADAGMIPGILLLSGTASTASSCSGPVNVFGPFWQDSSGGWHFGNVVPYSHVEKKAGLVYDALHSNKNSKEAFPVIVAEHKEIYEAAEKLLGGRTPGSMDRILEILERALSNETDSTDFE